MYKFKVITDKEVNKLEGLLNSGWELVHTVATDRMVVFIFRQAK